jgi:glycosyltransferase involved in cell wall biosynthesis
MRILELINNLEIGGAERMVVDLSIGLQQRGHQVTVACLRETGPLAAILNDAGIEVIALGKASGISPRTVRALARQLTDHEIDVVHTHNPIVHHYGTSSARLARVPLAINTLHGPGNLNGMGAAEMIFEVTCLFSDCVVACCQAVHSHLHKLTTIAHRRSVVIPNGIAVERFTSIAAPTVGSEIVFGTVGRLVPVKDHTSLLQAFAAARPRLPRPARLELLGDGPMRESLERQAIELGISDSVHFHGSTLDVAAFLERIDVFILCSSSEGLPLTLLEAMASARPVIGTRVGAIPEIVKGADCGFLIAPGNPAELSEALVRAAECGDLEQKGIRARRHVLDRYSIDQMVSGYEQLFETMLTDSVAGARRKIPSPGHGVHP